MSGEKKKSAAKAGYEVARDGAVMALVIWQALCVLSQPGTPLQKVAACCTKLPVAAQLVTAPTTP